MSEENKSKTLKPWVLKLWVLFTAFLYFIMVGYPLLDAYVLGRVSFDQQVDPELMNALLTASSILFGFSAFIIFSQGITEKERGMLWVLIIPPLVLTIMSGAGISNVALGRRNAVETTVLLTSCFNANIITTMFLVGYYGRGIVKREGV